MMEEIEELRINLDYLASTYGFSALMDAEVHEREDGGLDLVIEGMKK